MPKFSCFIGIDYSGAKKSTSSNKGLRVYKADGGNKPTEVYPPPSQRKYWTRKGIAHWLIEQLGKDKPTLVGIDHGFSFPLEYFIYHQLNKDWTSFLKDFQRHWPSDVDGVSVHCIRRDKAGNSQARCGDSHWRRLAEKRTKRAKSVFHFDVPGQVAYSTHAGIPWLHFIRQKLDDSIHFWPFDGWNIPDGKSAIAEIYPALWYNNYPREDRTNDQHDAYCAAAWLACNDRDGKLANFLNPQISDEDCVVAELEGWILGVD